MSKTKPAAQPLPLFYSGVEALDRDTHRALRLDRMEAPFAFAANAHVLPALLAEFPNAAKDMVILFIEENQEMSPLFLVGHRAGFNGFVNASGQWTGRHVPAYLRRYPFIGAASSESEQAICFDPGCTGLQKKSGESLFDEAGAPTATLTQVMEFVGEYFSAAQATQSFVRELKARGLFRSIDVTITTGKGHSSSFHGFFAVDEEKLGAMGDAEFGTLRKNGYLAGIFAHLMSLSNIGLLGERADGAAAEAA